MFRALTLNSGSCRGGDGLLSGALLFLCIVVQNVGAVNFTPDSIKNVMRKVSGYYLQHGVSGWGRTNGVNSTIINNDWDGGAYMSGIMGLYAATGQQSYLDSATQWAVDHSWLIGTDTPSNPAQTVPTDADNQCCTQTYCDLYLLDPTPANAYMYAPWERDLKLTIDTVPMAGRDRWWWCDALYMAPAAYAKLFKITHTRRYIDTLNKYWWDCAATLYDTSAHLWYRQASFNGQLDQNGKKIFWSCGNAWVAAGMARTIPNLPDSTPADDSTRQKYINQFKAMMDAIRVQQDTGGLWTTSLLDHALYPEPEASGTAFFGFAMAWGVLNGFLDMNTYLPVIKNAWSGCVAHVASNGEFQGCQYMGWEPASGFESYTTLEGNGAFLLFGNELIQLVAPVSTLPSATAERHSIGCTTRITPQSIIVTVPGALPGARAVAIFDLCGRKIDGAGIRTVAGSGNVMVYIDRARLANGFYTLQIRQGNKIISENPVMLH